MIQDCTVNSEIFARVLFSRNFAYVKLKSSRNAKLSQSFTNIGKSCPIREFLASQIILLTLFKKTKFSQKFPDLQYTGWVYLSRDM